MSSSSAPATASRNASRRVSSTSSTSTSRSRRGVSSTALRHSYSLNVATFHAPQERVLSTQVARPLVEIFFGRIDSRTVVTAATAVLLERYFPGPYELVEPAGAGRNWAEVAAEFEAIYRRLVSRRHGGAGNAEARRRIARRPLIEVDLHMHTDHSPDCATPVEVLLRRPATGAWGRSRSPTTTRSPARWRRAGSRPR